MGHYPSFSKSGANGRKILGLNDNPIWVEGELDAYFYMQINRKRKFCVGNNKSEVVSIGLSRPYPDCIIDDDFDFVLENEKQTRHNIYSTKILNDMESIWIYVLIQKKYFFEKYGEDIMEKVYENSSLVGRLRIITHRKSDSGRIKPWKMIFSENIDVNKMLNDKIWNRPLDYMIKMNNNNHHLKSKEQWLRKINVLEKENLIDRLQHIRGKDFIMFLYLELQKYQKIPNYRYFYNDIMKKSITIILQEPSVLNRLMINDLLSNKIIGTKNQIIEINIID